MTGEKMSGFTKEIIIRTLFELLNEKPLAKITVKDIVERCGVNRNTFYYHSAIFLMLWNQLFFGK